MLLGSEEDIGFGDSGDFSLTVEDEEIGGSQDRDYKEDGVVLFEEEGVLKDEVDFEGDGEKQYSDDSFLVH